MKPFLFLPFALVLGLVIGSWAPNEELRVCRKDIADLNAKLAAQEKGSRLDAFTRIVRIPDRASKTPAPRREPKTDDAAPPPDADVPDTVGTPAADSPPDVPPTLPRPSAPTPEDLGARIEEAKELWAARVQIARAQWLDRLKISDADAPRFDAVIDAMNADLQASLQSLADVLAADGELTHELGARLLSEMSSAVVGTYDALADVVPPDHRADASRMELTDFIDPAVAEPLIAVQSKLENIPRPSSGGRPRFQRFRR
jgi:hypothetical protein